MMRAEMKRVRATRAMAMVMWVVGEEEGKDKGNKAGVGRCTVHVVAARCFHQFTCVKEFGVFRCHQNSF